MPKSVYRVEIEMGGDCAVYDEQGNAIGNYTQLWIAKALKEDIGRQQKNFGIYVATDGKLHKIGVSRDIDRRMYQLELDLCHTVYCPSYLVFSFEHSLHVQLEDYKSFEKWPAREWFNFNSSGGQQVLESLQKINNDDELESLLESNALMSIERYNQSEKDEASRYLFKRMEDVKSGKITAR